MVIAKDDFEMQRVVDYVDEHLADKIVLKTLCDVVFMPANTLTRRFHKRHGISPMGWVWDRRVQVARRLLEEDPSAKLLNVSLMCGFTSMAHFSRRFRKKYGITASSMKKEFARA